MKRRTVLIAAPVAVLLSGTAAFAAWTASSSNGSGAAKATSMPAGNKPAASVSGRDVTVSWSASQIGGTAVSGYTVKRYAGSTAQTVNASCNTNQSGLTCTETGITPGTYTYTVTPLEGTITNSSHWTGTESSKSDPVTVGSPTFAGTSPTSVTSLPQAITGTLSNFVDNQALTFHLDSASGTTLSGTPAAVSSTGTASVSVMLPAGTPNGNHTIYAVTANGESAASATINLNLPAAGLALGTISTDTTPSMSCTGSPGAVTCASTGEANSSGNVLTATLTLTDSTGATFTNTSGSPITIDLSATGKGSVSPATLTVNNNASATSASFTATRDNGSGKTLTVTATIHGTTKQITFTLSS
jgi:hypothetical protein